LIQCEDAHANTNQFPPALLFTVVLYLTTTVIASILGIISILTFRNLFEEGQFDKVLPAAIKLGCNDEDMFITEGENGALACSTDMGNSSEFIIDDLTKTFATASGGVQGDITLSDTIYDGVFTKLITDNIISAFGDANFAAVVFFAIAFGVAVSRVFDQRGGADKSFILPFLKELDGVFITIINWIIAISPFAVFSLIASAIGGQDDLASSFTNVAYLVVATLAGYFLHFWTVHVALAWLITKTNPFPYLRQMIPAQTMAFACASSAATIPVTMRCVNSTGIIPRPVARFIVPLGATVNMDGSAIYFPCACIWLAILNGIDPNVGNYLLLVIISTIGSAGTAPVPSAGLVLIITAYNTVFSTTGVPEGFSYVVAIDWFMDRMQTVMNVTGDTMVCRMITAMCPMDGEELDAVTHAAHLDETPEDTTNRTKRAESDSVAMIEG
jgi:solute carrier family 1 (high affinity glutamate transporter) protein 2